MQAFVHPGDEVGVAAMIGVELMIPVVIASTYYTGDSNRAIL